MNKKIKHLIVEIIVGIITGIVVLILIGSAFEYGYMKGSGDTFNSLVNEGWCQVLANRTVPYSIRINFNR